MTNRHTVRGRSAISQPRKHSVNLDQPGAFQLALLRAFELPRINREIFLLKEIQGYTFAEIADILGISIDTARLRWKRARREFMRLGDSDAMERMQ